MSNNTITTKENTMELPPTPSVNNTQNSVEEEDWEEWDGSSPFWIHCAAGSLAGVAEHVAVYPLDTVRTHIHVAWSAWAAQANAAAATTKPTMTNPPFAPRLCRAVHHGTTTMAATVTTTPWSSTNKGLPSIGIMQTLRQLVWQHEESALAAGKTNTKSLSLSTGWWRLWRGVQAMMIGCIPAHALYFSSYEIVKNLTLSKDGTATAWGSSLAGGVAVVFHDLIMSPLDTIKQRMQLGHYATVKHAISAMYQQEGQWRGLYKSFPVTLATNIPYGMLMVSTHEMIKTQLHGHATNLSSWQTVLISSSMAGLVASAVTTPLDRIKTALQTQALLPKQHGTTPIGLVTTTASKKTLRFDSWWGAAQWIWQKEGTAGFFRGMAPRVLSHTPAVAISWTTYESTKQALVATCL
jgi:solute carrier family 25 iron transporter 28/37